MEIPFTTLNANLFGTKCLSLLFTSDELMNGYVDPSAKIADYDKLDSERIDLIIGNF